MKKFAKFIIVKQCFLFKSSHFMYSYRRHCSDDS